MTIRGACAIFILLLLYHTCNGGSETFRQEAAKVVYQNPKYVKDLSLFTFRHTRKSPYLTSANGTSLHVWENNVSIVIECYNARTNLDLASLEFKACDIVKASWAKDWLKEYSNVPPRCPVLPGSYMFKEMELPPKNFPIPLPAGDYTFRVGFLITKTKEKIVDLRMNLRFKGNMFGK